MKIGNIDESWVDKESWQREEEMRLVLSLKLTVALLPGKGARNAADNIQNVKGG